MVQARIWRAAQHMMAEVGQELKFTKTQWQAPPPAPTEKETPIYPTAVARRTGLAMLMRSGVLAVRAVAAAL